MEERKTVAGIRVSQVVDLLRMMKRFIIQTRANTAVRTEHMLQKSEGVNKGRRLLGLHRFNAQSLVSMCVLMHMQYVMTRSHFGHALHLQHFVRRPMNTDMLKLLTVVGFGTSGQVRCRIPAGDPILHLLHRCFAHVVGNF